ncbi:uncharacterized protein V1510DRAFT_179710 [Dipodascopsis tothii]|uniref:uncharacterized protein n=1 Tax=Dipodascopsis tothii TaxID=44089 RepID=UPI0034CF76E0
MSAKEAPTEDAIKQRIIAHMNKDHALSLGDYLEFYKGIIPSRGVRMIDITLEKVTIGYQNIHNKGIDDCEASIDFQPPMKSFAEAREVLVGMALQASEGLGYATAKPVDKYVAPRGASLSIVAVMLVGIYFVYWEPSYLDSPTNWLRQFKAGGHDVVVVGLKTVFYIVAVYHAVEAWIVYFWTGMYRVPTKKRALWTVTAFLEGFPAMGRFRALMEEHNEATGRTREHAKADPPVKPDAPAGKSKAN